MTTLDVSKLYDAFKTGGTLTSLNFNGVLYISDTTAATAPATERRGIRLVNGALIPQGGLHRCVRQWRLYPGGLQHGHHQYGPTPFESRRAPQTTPPNQRFPATNREPCAVVADAVMILSNNWRLDSNSTKDVSLRVATNTTVNTAIIAGIVPSGTSNGNYSGGAENFPRFMEDWGTDNSLTYYGSMVELFKLNTTRASGAR